MWDLSSQSPHVKGCYVGDPRCNEGVIRTKRNKYIKYTCHGNQNQEPRLRVQIGEV